MANSKYILFFFFLSLLFPFGAKSQDNTEKFVTLSGYVRDSVNGESLIGATIFNVLTQQGSTSNSQGFYSIKLAKGKNIVDVSFVGYTNRRMELFLEKDSNINVFLGNHYTLSAVEVVDTYNEEQFVRETSPSKVNISPEMIKSLPSLMGENDLLKTLQLIPGIKGGTEGQSGIYVRGGNVDQNLYLIDGIPIYNPNHLMGFISAFNTEAVKNIDFYKGGFPARYGGRLSSVADIRTKDGNINKLNADIGIGLISAKLNVDGPIYKDKTTFSLSARRTYLDLLLKPAMKLISDDSGDGSFGYHFVDLNAKINHRINSKNRLVASFYWGQDKFSLENTDESNSSDNTYLKSNSEGRWGNTIGSLTWIREINQKLFTDLSLSYNRYSSNITNKEVYKQGESPSEEFKFDYLSGIEDFSFSNNYNLYLNESNNIGFGLNYTHHTYSPELISIDEDFTDESSLKHSPSKIHANEISVFAEDEINLSKRLSVNAGLRFNAFMVEDETYLSLQPRLSVRYSIIDALSAKASYSMMNQNIHLLTMGMLSFPTDLWLPVTKGIKPNTAHQFNAGVYYTLKNICNMSVEGYYKKMYNIIDYKDGAKSLLSYGWQDRVAQGEGESYGVEFMIQRERKKINAWISYTLSWSFREYPNGEINAGKRFYDQYDYRHVVNISVAYKINEKIDCSATWVYNSGSRFTLNAYELEYPSVLPSANDNSFSNSLNIYDEKNACKLPAYHRLDLNINFKKQKKHGTRIWTVSIYNAYNRKNPSFVFPSSNTDKLTAICIMPIIPTVSYCYKFK